MIEYVVIYRRHAYLQYVLGLGGELRLKGSSFDSPASGKNSSSLVPDTVDYRRSRSLHTDTPFHLELCTS